MKFFLAVIVLVMASVNSNAQVDEITKHNGEIIKGKILRVEEYAIVYSYDGEDAENTIGKYAVKKMVYGKSGRVEGVTEKITITSDKDWEKVVILEDKSCIAGLTKVGEVRGRTSFINFQILIQVIRKQRKNLKWMLPNQDVRLCCLTLTGLLSLSMPTVWAAAAVRILKQVLAINIDNAGGMII